MSIISSEQAKSISTMVEQGLSDFDIAQQVAAGDDPEMYLESVSTIREARETDRAG